MNTRCNKPGHEVAIAPGLLYRFESVLCPSCKEGEVLALKIELTSVEGEVLDLKRTVSHVAPFRGSGTDFAQDVWALLPEAEQPQFLRSLGVVTEAVHRQVTESLRSDVRAREMTISSLSADLQREQSELAKVADELKTAKMRTVIELAEDRDGWKQQAEQCDRAWCRELGGKLIPKTHRIDALVLTTKYFMERLEKYQNTLAAATMSIETINSRISQAKMHGWPGPDVESEVLQILEGLRQSFLAVERVQVPKLSNLELTLRAVLKKHWWEASGWAVGSGTVVVCLCGWSTSAQKTTAGVEMWIEHIFAQPEIKEVLGL